MGADPANCIMAATAIARHDRCVLLIGNSGRGKSDLALRAITSPLRLAGEAQPALFEFISDDQTALTRQGAQIVAAAPAAIKDQLEVRGLGIVAWPSITGVRVCLVADLSDGPIDRMPQEPVPNLELLGLHIPIRRFAAFEASAHIKIALSLTLTQGPP